MSLLEKYDLINKELKKCTSTNPIEIINNIMSKDIINMHGPEHHYLDGACFLMAYYNACKESNKDCFDINEALNKLAERSLKMPGAMCGHWGVCGSCTSVGAALSIINNVGPLTDSNYYKDDMKFTSKVINIMSEIGGPRCCKRNAFISLSEAVKFVRENYNINLEIDDEIKCNYFNFNKQCIKNRCPFYSENY